MKKSRTNAEKEAAPVKRPVNKDKPAHAGQEEGLEGLIPNSSSNKDRNPLQNALIARK